MIKIIIHDKEDWELLCSILEDMEKSLEKELNQKLLAKHSLENG
jgi:hypothetical protein